MTGASHLPKGRRQATLRRMTRREFIRASMMGAFYLAARRVFPASLATGAVSVGVATGADYAKATTLAVDLVGGMRSYVKPGSTVVVKPNIGWNSPPEVKATTDPVVVRTIVHLCFQAGASKVYVFDRSVSNPRLAYVTSGIEKAAREAGASVVQVDDVESDKIYKKIVIPDALSLAESLVNRYALESDVFINVPIAKSHGEAGLTLGMKNLMGITGDQRARWHWHLNESIADINRLVKSHLTVIDASAIMLRNGPTGGRGADLKRLDTFIASSNVVSADAEAAGLFGWKGTDLPYVMLAEDAGIGRATGYSVKKGQA
jgi:uncharacterized protein (DUF362 family)